MASSSEWKPWSPQPIWWDLLLHVNLTILQWPGEHTEATVLPSSGTTLQKTPNFGSSLQPENWLSQVQGFLQTWMQSVTAYGSKNSPYLQCCMTPRTLLAWKTLLLRSFLWVEQFNSSTLGCPNFLTAVDLENTPHKTYQGTNLHLPFSVWETPEALLMSGTKKEPLTTEFWDNAKMVKEILEESKK